MSLPLLHAGRTNPGLSAALDLRFALDKSLTAYRGPTPSFSRASTGTYFNASGVLTSAAINAPRFNHTYNGTSWVSRGLLVEEQRSNIFNNSGLPHSVWNRDNFVTGTPQIASPDGTMVDKSVPSTTNTPDHRIYTTASIISGTNYSYSIHLKSGGYYRFAIVFYDGTFRTSVFNVSSGTVLQTGAGCTCTISNCGNDWYRCTVIRTSASTLTGYFYVIPIDSDTYSLGSSSFAGDGTSGGYIWGAQLEAGSFPTSYIGTSGSSVTRSADVCQITGGDFSGFWNGTEGTLAFDADGFSTTTDNQFITSVSGGSVSNSINLVRSNANDITGVGSSVLAGGVLQEAMNAAAGTMPSNISCKLSFAYKANDFAQSVNGAAVTTDTSGSIPTVSQMVIGNAGWTTGPLNGHIARLRYFNKRLPNATLQLLSEPDPTLNLQFALNKTLTPVAGPAPSFSRASTGTYFDSTGTLKYANVNLITYSEQFDNAVWIKGNSSISANTILSPDGNTTADKLVENSSNTPHQLYQTKTLTAASYTFSAYMKAGSRTWAAFNITPGTDTWTFFDLSNGVVGTVGSGHTASINNAGNGWYRCSVTVTGTAALWYFVVANANGNNGQVYTGDGSSGIYIWGAQLELASSPSQYAKTEASTTAGPRFDHVYSGGQWVSRGLLIEEQRTNLFRYSEDLTDAVWFKGTVAVSGNQANSPDGNLTADLVYPSSSGFCYIEQFNSTSGSGQAFTWSFFAKASGVNWIVMNGLGSSTSFHTWFNVSNGTIGTTGPGVTAKIENVGNGWYRCSVSNARTGTVYTWATLSDADGSTNVTKSGTNGVLIWGAQLEVGSFPTSYTGTTSSSVTRSADVCQITGTSFNWIWNQGEGSVVAEFDTNAPSVPLATSGFNTQIFAARDSSNNQRIYLGTENFGGRRFYIDDGAGSSSVISPGALIGNGVVNKASVAWKTNDMAASFDGASVLTDNSQIIPLGITAIDFGKSPANTNYLCGHIAKLIYYPARLTNTKLQQLST